MKTIKLSLLSTILFFAHFLSGQTCDPPLAVCQDVTVTLDSTGEAHLTPAMLDGGSISLQGMGSLSLDISLLTCDDLDPASTPYGDFLREFGCGQIGNTGTIKFGPFGQIYLVDLAQKVILKWDDTGNLLQTIGTNGFGLGQFASIRGLEVTHDRIYATDDNRDKVLVFDYFGNFLFEFGTSGSGPGQFTNPWRVTVVQSQIYVLDWVQDKVLVFDDNGIFLFEFGSTGTNPGQFDAPTDMDTTVFGNVSIYDQHRRKVITFDLAGNFLGEFGESPSGTDFTGEFDIVQGIAIGADGRVYAADRSSTTLNNKVKVFQGNGDHVYEFGFNGNGQGKFRNIYSMDVRYDNLIAVADIQRDVVMLFEQKMGGNLVTLSITDSLGTEACCIAEVTLVENNNCTAPDGDGDGYTVSDGDCDDANPDIYPGAAELCDNIDNNCDGIVDEDLGVYFGNFFVQSQADLDSFGSYSEVTGNLNIIGTDVSDLTPLSCLRKVKQLVITSNPNLQSLDGVENIEEITGSLRIVDNSGLSQITEFQALQSIGQNAGISDNINVQMVSFPNIISFGDFVFSLELFNHPLLDSIYLPQLQNPQSDFRLQLLPALEYVHIPQVDTFESLLINQVGLTDLLSFGNVQKIKGSFNLNNCPNINTLNGLNSVEFGTGIYLLGNQTLSSLGSLGTNQSLENLIIRSNNQLISLSGMEDVNSISGNLEIRYNANLSDCCAIAELLDNNAVLGTINISNNPNFCQSEAGIISYCLDNDGDGYTTGDGDCDDENAAIYPGAIETCNGIDDNCNGLVDTQDSTFVDTMPPYFVGHLPSNMTVACDAIPSVDSVFVEDDCSVSIAFSQTANYDGYCGSYEIERIWVAEDSGGNVISHTQTIYVVDSLAPEFGGSLPPDTLVEEGQVPIPVSLQAVDNCSSGNPVYMEMDPIDPSNESLVLTGALGSTSVSWTLEGVNTSQFKFRDVYADNSLTTFSNAQSFTPSSSGLDGAGFNAISGTALLRILFSEPVSNPVLHINNIDISRWDFSPTTTNISLLSGNDQIQLIDGVLSDPSPETSGGALSGQGSILFHGEYTEIIAELSLVDVTTDGLFLQLSAHGPVEVEFSESSTPGVCPGDEIIVRSWMAEDGCGLVTQHSQTVTVEGFDAGPEILSISVPVDPISLGTDVALSGIYVDSCDLDDHTVIWTWGDGTVSTGIVDQSTNEAYGNHTYDSTGVYQVAMTLEDDDGNRTTLISIVYVVIYNPTGGFVTGGGWIQSPPGAYLADSTVVGKANFGFVSKYKKGSSTPEGNTQFQFNAASLKFKSTAYDWLVIAGDKAKFKGDGKINNQGSYGFMLTGIDGDLQGNQTSDKFRIKIWDKNNGDQVVYDNQLGTDDLGYDAQELQGGSITIHPDNAQTLRSGINTRSTDIGFKVFPNPAYDLIQVETDLEYGEKVRLTIHDQSGKIIYVKGWHIGDRISIDVSSWSSGVYFVSIRSERYNATKKLVILP